MVHYFLISSLMTCKHLTTSIVFYQTLNLGQDATHEARTSMVASTAFRLKIALGSLTICRPCLAFRTTVCLLNTANNRLFLSSTTTSFGQVIFTSRVKSVENSLLGVVKVASLSACSSEISSSATPFGDMTSSVTVFRKMTSSLMFPDVNSLKMAVNTMVMVLWLWTGMRLRTVFNPETARVTAQGTNTLRAAGL